MSDQLNSTLKVNYNTCGNRIGFVQEKTQVSVRLRLKRMGRTHRPFYRLCAIDKRRPRDGRVIEELGYYDPMVKETDARARLNGERIDYWLSVGAQPSDKVKVLIKKYGTDGTHLEAQQQALGRLSQRSTAPSPVAVSLPKKEESPPAEEAPAAEEAAASEQPSTAEGESADG